MTHDGETILNCLLEASKALESAWNVELSSVDWLRGSGNDIHGDVTSQQLPRKVSSTLNAFYASGAPGSRENSPTPSVKSSERKKFKYPYNNSK